MVLQPASPMVDPGSHRAAPEAVRPPGPASVTYRRLRLCGLTTIEAGNLTARLEGLQIGATPWSLREVEHLLFLRTLVAAGRIDS